MPQEMNVLCCYACNMYQVHVVKKSNKWQCKICGAEQSIQVVYFQGSGIDCRHQVQHLNSLKAAKDEEQTFSSPTIDIYGLDCEADENEDEEDVIDPCHCPKRRKTSNSKWSKYLEPCTDVDNDENDANDDLHSQKENFASQENPEIPENWLKLRYSTKKSNSCPGTQSYASSSDLDDTPVEARACSSKSRSFPLAERSLKVFNKWDQYLNSGRKEEQLLCSEVDSSSVTTSPPDCTRESYKFAGIKSRASSSDFQKVALETRGCSSNKRSYPLNIRPRKTFSKWDQYLESGREEQVPVSEVGLSSTATSSSDCKKLPSKWDKFLEDPKDEAETNPEVEDARDGTPTNNSTVARNQSTKCNIFEDYNDDLDLTIDF